MKKNEIEFLKALKEAGLSRSLCESINDIRRAVFEGLITFVPHKGYLPHDARRRENPDNIGKTMPFEVGDILFVNPYLGPRFIQVTGVSEAFGIYFRNLKINNLRTDNPNRPQAYAIKDDYVDDSTEKRARIEWRGDTPYAVYNDNWWKKWDGEPIEYTIIQFPER